MNHSKKHSSPLSGLSGINLNPRALSPGQSAVELALTSLVLIFLLLGAADFARVYFLSNEVETAARAGVQYGVQSSGHAADFTGMQQAAMNDAPDIQGLTATASNFCQCPGTITQFACSAINNCADKRTYVQVVTTATFTPAVKWPGLPSSLPISAKATMRTQ